MQKKFWRCNVCNDIHYGMAGPETCPTCTAKHAYCEIDMKEAANVTGDAKEHVTDMDSKALRSAWERFTEKNEFVLNPDKAHVDTIIQGVQQNEEKFGLRLCPCMMRDGSRPKDLELICPCNFKTHETWKDPKKQYCWCGLFVKKKS